MRLYVKQWIKALGKILSDFSDRITYYHVSVLERRGDWILCKTPTATWRLCLTHGIDNEIIRSGSFEKRSFPIMERMVRSGMHVADVGANFGYYTVRLSQLVGASGVVHAFEPSTIFRNRLNEHLGLNGCTNVRVLDFGLSNKAGTIPLLESDDSATVHWWYGGEKEKTKSVIRLKTFDRFVREHGIKRMDFMKIDIDGHEPNFLCGANNSLIKLRPVMLMEFMQLALRLNDSDVETLANDVRALGYDLYSETTGQPYATRHDFLVEAANAAFSVNVFCIPKERSVGSLFPV